MDFYYLFYICVHAESLQSCWTLCDPMDCSLPGSSVHGVLQARILEWVSMPSSRGSSWPRDRTCVSYLSCVGRWVLYYWRHLRSHFIYTSGIWWEGNGTPLQYSCLENPMDRGAWWAIVHRITKSLTRLKRLGMHHSVYMSISISGFIFPHLSQ